MLNFRNVNIFFAIAFVLLLYAGRNQNFGWGIYVLLVMIFLAVQFYGCCFINSGFHLKAYCQKNTSEKEVAITFDDGPDKKVTPKILNTLREFNAPAAFFCIGNKIKGNESLLQQLYNEGHIIGNHSYSHDIWFDLFSAERMTKELTETGAKIQSVIGLQPKFFRPPYGVTNPNLRKAVNRLKYLTIGWNIRSLDTVIKDADKVFENVRGKIKPGSVILLHDSVSASEIVLPKLLHWLKENQYKVIRIDEMFNLTAYE
ncbi:MAG TPA: polysaccharide deacetylase family protein [Bacteroidia bacterium]|nr:polysaccharide deacetylase family protein [Bacteroidia bacterium]